MKLIRKLGTKRMALAMLALISLVGLAASQAFRAEIGAGHHLHARNAAAEPVGVAANGAIEGADREVYLKPEINGMIAAVHCQEGQTVHPGDVLIELSNGVQKQRMALAHAQYQNAKARWDRARKMGANAISAENRDNDY